MVGGLGRVAHIFEHPSAKREDENKVAQVGEAPRDGHPSAKREDENRGARSTATKVTIGGRWVG